MDQLQDFEAERILRAIGAARSKAHKLDQQSMRESMHKRRRRYLLGKGVSESEAEAYIADCERCEDEGRASDVPLPKFGRSPKPWPRLPPKSGGVFPSIETRYALLAVRKWGQVFKELDKAVPPDLTDEERISAFLRPLARRFRLEKLILWQWQVAHFREEARRAVNAAKVDLLRRSPDAQFPSQEEVQAEIEQTAAGDAATAIADRGLLVVDFARFIAMKRARSRQGLPDLKPSEWSALWFYESEKAPQRLNPDSDLDVALAETDRLEKRVRRAGLPSPAVFRI